MSTIEYLVNNRIIKRWEMNYPIDECKYTHSDVKVIKMTVFDGLKTLKESIEKIQQMNCIGTERKIVVGYTHEESIEIILSIIRVVYPSVDIEFRKQDSNIILSV